MVTAEAVRKKGTTTIIVNGRSKEVGTKELSYDDIVNLAFDNNPPTGPYVVITVTYSKGVDRKEGSMQKGDMVRIKEGMIFDVTATDRS